MCFCGKVWRNSVWEMSAYIRNKYLHLCMDICVTDWPTRGGWDWEGWQNTEGGPDAVLGEKGQGQGSGSTPICHSSCATTHNTDTTPITTCSPWSVCLLLSQSQCQSYNYSVSKSVSKYLCNTFPQSFRHSQFLHHIINMSFNLTVDLSLIISFFQVVSQQPLRPGPLQCRSCWGRTGKSPSRASVGPWSRVCPRPWWVYHLQYWQYCTVALIKFLLMGEWLGKICDDNCPLTGNWTEFQCASVFMFSSSSSFWCITDLVSCTHNFLRERVS